MPSKDIPSNEEIGMREEYTPTTEAVRRDYIFAQGSNDTGEQRLEGEEFDRWLAAHDAEVFQRGREDVARERDDGK